MANALDIQVDNARTLQESYNQIAGAADAYNTGKVELAQNITAKGVQASATETLPELAQKVLAISQDTYQIDGGELYAKQLFGSPTTPNYWNLYEVLEMLLSDGRLVNYGGRLLAEFYKGYDSLALSGAGAGGAYVVSDMENGEFKMYTADTTHTWNDVTNGKGNRWVAYCFDGDWHDFQIVDANVCPRSIFIGRKVGKITSLVNGRVSQIVVPDIKDGQGNKICELGDLQGGFTQNWDKRVVLNIKEHTSGTLLYLTGMSIPPESIYIKGNVSGGVLIDGGAPTSVIIDGNGGDITTSSTRLINTLPTLLQLSNIENLTVARLSNDISSNKTAIISAINITVTDRFYANPNGGTVIFDKLESFNNAHLAVGGYLDYLYVGYDTNDRAKSISWKTYYNTDGLYCNDIEIKDGWMKSIKLGKMARNMTAENIALHILDRLGDNSGQSILTLNLGAAALATIQNDPTYSSYLTDAVDNKNWNIQA